MATYCDYCNSHPEDTFNRIYHDTQYGFPLKDDNLLFERLILEINQAGLSWITILKKADNFHNAYNGFDIDKVAKYGEKDVARLLADAVGLRFVSLSAVFSGVADLKRVFAEARVMAKAGKRTLLLVEDLERVVKSLPEAA